MKEKKYQPPKVVNPEHKKFLVAIGKKLQKLRNNDGITISGFSTKVGISRNAYRLMETGDVYFNMGSLMHILSYYDLEGKVFFKDL